MTMIYCFFRIFFGLIKLIGIVGLMIYCLPIYCIYYLIEDKDVKRVCLWTFSTEGDIRFIAAGLFWTIPPFLIMMFMGYCGYRF